MFVQESSDKQFLLRKIAKLEGRDFDSPQTTRKRRGTVHQPRADDDVDHSSSTAIEMSRVTASNGYGQNAPPGVMYDDM